MLTVLRPHFLLCPHILQNSVTAFGVADRLQIKPTSVRSMHRAQIYLKNEELMKLEKANFEKLKADVASGAIELEEPIWSTGEMQT